MAKIYALYKGDEYVTDGGKIMGFWKYNIDDEILFEGKAYRIANQIDDRYII